MTLPQIAVRLVLVTSIAISAGAPLAQTSPAAAIADGQPWNSIDPKGRAMQLTFFSDGTAKAKVGPFGKSLTWSPTDEGICLYGTPGGDKCITLLKTENGYQGIENGQVALQLSR